MKLIRMFRYRNNLIRVYDNNLVSHPYEWVIAYLGQREINGKRKLRPDPTSMATISASVRRAKDEIDFMLEPHAHYPKART